MAESAKRPESRYYAGAMALTASRASVFLSFENDLEGFMIGCREFHMYHPNQMEKLLFWDANVCRTKGPVMYKSLIDTSLDIVEMFSFLTQEGRWEPV